MTKKSKATAENFVDTTNRLEVRSNALRNNLASNLAKQGRIQNEISGFNSALAGLRNRVAGGGANLDREIREYEEKIDALRAEEALLDEDIGNINDSLSEITLESETLNTTLSQDDVLAFLDTLRESEERLPLLSASIEEQETIEREAGEIESQLPELEEQREDLFAARTIGEATEAEIDAVTAAIDDEETRLAPLLAEAEGKIAAANKTRMGLIRLLEEATFNHNLLLEKRPQIMAAYLRSEGVGIGKQYLEAAEVLIEKFTKLVAFDRLCEQLLPKSESGPGFFGHEWRGVHLPALHSESGTAKTGESRPKPLFAVPLQFAQKFCLEATHEVEQELVDAGISL